jgi:hypothetical protein
VKQLTDNDSNDVYPDVHHGKVVWMQAPVGDTLGEIMLYNYYDHTTNQISPGYGIHNVPYIYGNEVAWLGYGFNTTNYVFYYDGTTTTDIAQPDKGRYSLSIGECDVAMKRIKSHKSTNLWIIISLTEVVKSHLRIIFLACKAIVVTTCTRYIILPAKWIAKPRIYPGA